ncbi:chaperonin 10-like protein [Boletus reticuloceps]|uniref:Chaperonin 10-like protein n=1 Tax=Boletus reticuloceps TaxID=495285 RepID=A0A8I2YVK4_9AGAM|nr:chaperonin 10-like protein [Boletus reticuloceps]
MTTQKALWLPNIGAEYTLGQNEIPEPGPGEVLVQLEAIALNALDWKVQQSGFFMVKEYPAIVGEDGAGVVRKVGDGVTNLSQGDKVSVLSSRGACRRAGTHYSHIVRFFLTSFGNKYATCQEYCLTNAQLAVKIPPSISFEQAASVSAGFIPFAVATYAQQPQGLGFIPPFEEGGLGRYAGQPILSGFSPIITTASLHNKDFLISLGATHVLDRTIPVTALRDQIAQIPTVPLTYIFDAVSLEETQQTALSLLAPGGTLIVVTFPSVNGDQDNKKVRVVIGTFHLPENHAVGVKFSIALTKWLEEGTIKPNKIEVLPGG